MTACPPWIKDCPASEKTTYYTTETVAAYTTVCPVESEETTKLLSPPAAVTQGRPGGAPDEELTTSIVMTTMTYSTKVCPSSVHHCLDSQKTATVTTETIVAYTTVCPVASEETTKAAVAPVITEHPTGSAGEKFTTSTVYTTTAYATKVCPSQIPYCAESQKTISTTTETLVAYVTVCPVTKTEGMGMASTPATAPAPQSEGESSFPTDTAIRSSIHTSVGASVYNTLPGESAVIGNTATSNGITTVAGTKTFITLAESTGASSPNVYTSKLAHSNESGSNGSDAESVRSKSSLTGFTDRGAISWLPIKTSQASASVSQVSHSTPGTTSSGSSATISPSAAPAATFTGSAPRGSAGITLALCILAAVGYFAF